MLFSEEDRLLAGFSGMPRCDDLLWNVSFTLVFFVIVTVALHNVHHSLSHF